MTLSVPTGLGTELDAPGFGITGIEAIAGDGLDTLFGEITGAVDAGAEFTNGFDTGRAY